MDDSYVLKTDEIIYNVSRETLCFKTIIEKSTGIHPVDILNSIRRLHNNKIISNESYQELIRSAEEISEPKPEGDINTLPVPHQVDFDWRFSKKGIEYFVDYINDEMYGENCKIRIALIGSPSLFRYFCVNSIDNVEVFLIDFNAKKHIGNFKIPEYAHILDCNLHYNIETEYEVNEIQADIIVMDPPWYLEYYEKFFEISNLVGANQCLVIGVAPPILTRDTIIAERQQINSFVDKFGFDDLHYEALCIEYDIPPFERNVLRVNKINNYSAHWRKGDFFFTRREYRKDLDIYFSTYLAAKGSWTEKKVGIIRFKLRQDIQNEDINFSIKLNSLYEKDIYPSVSRRYEGHEKINVWTSGNRVFHCTNIPVLIIILEHLYEINIIEFLECEYAEKIPSVEKKQIEEVRKIICLLIEMEHKEYGKWIE